MVIPVAAMSFPAVTSSTSKVPCRFGIYDKMLFDDISIARWPVSVSWQGIGLEEEQAREKSGMKKEIPLGKPGKQIVTK